MQAKDETIESLKKRIKNLELILKGFGEVFGEEMSLQAKIFTVSLNTISL